MSNEVGFGLTRGSGERNTETETTLTSTSDVMTKDVEERKKEMKAGRYRDSEDDDDEKKRRHWRLHCEDTSIHQKRSEK